MSMKFREEFNTVGFFYLMSLFYWIAIGFMAAYWTLYFVGLGFSFSTISLILLMYPIAALIFEIPTGAIADVFGRKISVCLSYLLTSIAFVGILLSKASLSLLLLFHFIAGISFTLETGALESWFIDTVKHKKKSKHLHRLLGRWGSLSSIGFVIGPFLGGILVTYGVDKAFWATAAGMFILAFFIFIVGKEEYFVKQKTEKITQAFQKTLKTGKQGFKYTFKHPVVLMLTLIMALLRVANVIAFNAYQPHVVEAGLPPQFLGFALSVAGFISIFSLNYSHKIVKFVGGNRRSLMFFTLLFGLAVLGIGSIKYLPLLFLSIVAYVSTGEFCLEGAPAFKELFNKFVPSEIRATVLSTNSFNANIGEIFGLFAFGLISDYLGLQTGIVFAGILIGLISFLYLKVRNSE